METETGKILSGGEPAGSGADDRHSLVLGDFGRGDGLARVGVYLVGDESFQGADINGFIN